MGGDFAEIPDDAEPGHELEGVIRDVDLPPEEALTGGSHEVMMIVVPAFTEGEQGEKPVVAAGVGGFVAARAEEVGEGVDGEGVVPEQHGAQAEAPDEEGPSADEPADVGPEEAEERGGMQVQFLVGMAVMVAMVGGPPEHALLRRGGGHEGDDELEDAAGLEGTVRKITVIAGGDKEHAHNQQAEASDQVIPVKGHEENQEGSEVYEHKGQGKKNRNPRAVRQWYGQIARS